METLTEKLAKLWRDFDYITDRLKENLEFGGKLPQESVDRYNYLHSEITKVTEQIEREVI